MEQTAKHSTQALNKRTLYYPIQGKVGVFFFISVIEEYSLFLLHARCMERLESKGLGGRGGVGVSMTSKEENVVYSVHIAADMLGLPIVQQEQLSDT